VISSKPSYGENMKNYDSKPTAYTVQICFSQKVNEDQSPKQPDVYIDFPLGTPLPHTGDKILIGDTFYKVADRSLIVSDNVIRNVSWSLVVEKV